MSATTTTTPSNLSPHYTCHHCRKTFDLQGPVIIGETPEARLTRVAQSLTKHLGENHKHEFTQIFFAGQQFIGWLSAAQFDHNDAALEEVSEQTRKRIRKVTRRQNAEDEAEG